MGTESDRNKCGKCRHFRPDPDAGRRYFGEPHTDAGWCMHPEENPEVDTLSGDWCADFEAKP